MDQTTVPMGVTPEVDASASAPFSRVCVLTLGGGQYAVDLQHIREVFPLESVTPVPGMPLMLIGVTNVRGSIVPLLDLRLLLRLSQPETVPPFAVVLRHEDYLLAVLVDQSPEIVTVLPEQFLPAPKKDQDGSGASEPFISGTLRINDQPSPVLDVPLLVEYVESEGTE